ALSEPYTNNAMSSVMRVEYYLKDAEPATTPPSLAVSCGGGSRRGSGIAHVQPFAQPAPRGGSKCPQPGERQRWDGRRARRRADPPREHRRNDLRARGRGPLSLARTRE